MVSTLTGYRTRCQPSTFVCCTRVSEFSPVDLSLRITQILIYRRVFHRHFACCLGDTLASELGILSPTPPILITTLKPVPPGTNGAMSLGGTLASIAGGLIMGITMFVCLIFENSKCREQWFDVVVPLLAWGTAAGGLGSLVIHLETDLHAEFCLSVFSQLDSLMGATIQRTRYSSETKRILQDHSEESSGSDIKVISGINILTNNQVCGMLYTPCSRIDRLIWDRWTLKG